jgi:hypothetical protein
MSPLGRSRTPAAPSTSWPPPAAKGFPSAHQPPEKTEALQGRGDVVSYAAAIIRSGRRSKDPRTLHTRRHLTALAAEGTSCSTQRTPPAARSTPLSPKAAALGPRPCHGRGGKPPAQSPQSNAGEAELKERRWREAARQHLAAEPSSPPGRI